MFDQGEFSARVSLAKVYLIHERTDEEDAAAGATHDVFGGKGIRDGLRIEAGSLVYDLHEQIIACCFERDGDVLAGIVGVAVKNGVDDCLADCHGDVAARIFVEANALGILLGCLFCAIDAREGRGERHADTACSWVRQTQFLDPELASKAEWQKRLSSQCAALTGDCQERFHCVQTAVERCIGRPMAPPFIVKTRPALR